MRVGFDLSVAAINQAGTGIYARSLIDALQQLPSHHVYRIFSVAQQRDMSARKTIRSRLDTLYRDLIWTHIMLPWKAQRSDIDILHMPANVIPISIRRPTVVTILDTTVIQSPQNFPRWQRTYANVLIPFAAKHTCMIVTISEQSKNDIVKHLHVPPEKVAVTQLAVSSAFRPLAGKSAQNHRNDRDSYILTVGTLEPRKNIIRLLQALAELRDRGACYRLVHAGPKGWLFDDILTEVERLGLQDAVQFRGRVQLDELVKLYNAASVFVYPSLYEGFGLPILEAMACGCPVITSDTSSLPEVAGDAAILVNPLDVHMLAAAIHNVMDDRALAQHLRQSGQARASMFSWKRCAEETTAVYRKVLGS